MLLTWNFPLLKSGSVPRCVTYIGGTFEATPIIAPGGGGVILLIYHQIIGTNAGSHGTCYLAPRDCEALEGSSRAEGRMTVWNL